tara:strand:+ start:1555 stop:1851 length:297 start_codon:yes stop_codon:yes gene_type:complete
LISHVAKFFLIFVFFILFLSFKNQIKILENDLSLLKNNFNKDSQNYINKEILLTKEINQLQIKKLSNYHYPKNQKIIRFDRNEFNDFTIIKVNYAQPE